MFWIRVVRTAKEPTIFLEFRGQTAGACKLDSDQCVEIALVYGATHQMQTEDAAEMDSMWAARRGCYIAAGKVREKRGDSVYLSDTCVPISKLAESVEVRMSRSFVCIIPLLYTFPLISEQDINM